MSPLTAAAALLIHEFRDPFSLLFHSPPLAHSSFPLPYLGSTTRPTLWYATTLGPILWRPMTALWQAHNKAIQKTAGFFSLYASACHNAVIRVRSPFYIWGQLFIFAHGVYTCTWGRKRIGIQGQSHLALHVLRREKRNPWIQADLCNRTKGHDALRNGN